MNGPTSSWGDLVAAAQAAIGVFQDVPNAAIESAFDENASLPLTAAARILDSASQRRGVVPREERKSLALLAAVAFAMHGNFPSATAVVKRSFHDLDDCAEWEAALIATIAPACLNRLIRCCESPVYVDYLTQLNYFLSTGEANELPTLRTAFRACIVAALQESSYAAALFASAANCLENLCVLATARVLRENCPWLPANYTERLLNADIKALLPPQHHAIVRQQLIASQQNTLVSLPTSTGKTLIGEMCLVSALSSETGLGCYLVPYIALGNQIADLFRRHIPPEIRVHRLVGGFKLSEHLRPDRRRELIVATPERLDALLRLNSDLIQHLRCIVCDEAHLLQNGARGVRLEGILTRLRLMQKNGHSLRIVLLSAVLSKDTELRRWLDIADDAVLTDPWRPTARRLAIWKREKLTWYMGADPLKPSGATGRSVLGEIDLPWPQPRIFSTDEFATIKTLAPRVFENVAYLCSVLFRTYSAPILCVCATKDGSRKMAVKAAEQFQEISPLPEQIEKAVQLIDECFPVLKPLARCLQNGVAYHNSTVPPAIRELIESAVRSRELRVVASTTTLAEGVDLPFRFTIIVEWMTWDRGQQRPMTGLLFRNVAGRCGRAGTFTEGDTIIFDNPLGDVRYTDNSRRDLIQQQLFLTSSEVELVSALENPSISLSAKDDVAAVLSSQFLAAIPENPHSENLVNDFLSASFLSARDRPQQIEKVKAFVQKTRSGLIDESEGAFARAASPLHLTELGVAANETGFSPSSVRDILGFLRNWKTRSGAPTLLAFAVRALTDLSSLPEQSSEELRKAATKNARPVIKPKDFEPVLAGWLSGKELETMFQSLPSVIGARTQTTIDEWLSGNAAGSIWDGRYDKFADFVSTVLEAYLPWVLRACAVLSPFVGPQLRDCDFRLWADMVEYGVDTRWAAAARSEGAPASRPVIVAVGRQWPAQMSLPNDPLGLVPLANDWGQNAANEAFAELTRRFALTPQVDAVARVQAWVHAKARRAVINPD
jgi:helicase